MSIRNLLEQSTDNLMIDVDTVKANTIESNTDFSPPFTYSGDWVPVVGLQGGSQWDLTGATAEGTFMRYGNKVSCCVNINIPAGTAGVTANLGLTLTSLPFPAAFNFTCGICNAFVSSIAATNPAVANGSVTIRNVDEIGLNLVGISGINRAGTSADPHTAAASFQYDLP